MLLSHLQLFCREALQNRVDLADQVRASFSFTSSGDNKGAGILCCISCSRGRKQNAEEIRLQMQALVKIKAKHNEENFTLTLPEYEEILDALVGSHYTNVPDHLSHESHQELGQLLLQVRHFEREISYTL